MGAVVQTKRTVDATCTTEDIEVGEILSHLKMISQMDQRTFQLFGPQNLLMWICFEPFFQDPECGNQPNQQAVVSQLNTGLQNIRCMIDLIRPRLCRSSSSSPW